MTDKKSPIRSFDQISTDLLETISNKCYSPETINNYRRALSRIDKFMEMEGFHSYSEEVGEAFITSRVATSYISDSHFQFMQMVIRRLNDVIEGNSFRLIKPEPLIQPPPQYSEALDLYLQHCVNIDNNMENTVSWKRSVCSKFLWFISELGCSNYSDINTNYICRAIVRHTNKDAYAIIKAFIQYLYDTGILEFDYSGIIPKYSRGKVLPTAYSNDEVRRLEAIIDWSSKTGKRDYASLLLATRLGLRAGDIVSLTFEKVDFTSNTINLNQEKTNQPLTLPLLPEIKKAIDEYIHYARPSSDSEFIFLRANAPYERMSTGVMRHAITKYFLAAGINISDKKHGSHSLRSSLASSMVNDGTPYEVVRRLLGHNDPNAVKYYARVDIENLRPYAIDVPPPSGRFEDLLTGRE